MKEAGQAPGVHERASFLGPGMERIFGRVHVAREAAEGGVVICSSILGDFQANYRREVLLARILAARGFAVQRFHYRGTGNSDGDSASMEFKDLRDDSIFAATALQSSCSVTWLAFVGTRWGGLVAASATASFPGAPLVLWEPTLDPQRFFHEGFRARMMRASKEGQAGASAGELVDELRTKGFVDLLGNRLDRALYDSCIGRTLDSEFGKTARPVLIVQIGSSGRIRQSYQMLADVLKERGCTVDLKAVDARESWWFVDERPPDQDVDELLELTGDWLERQAQRMEHE